MSSAHAPVERVGFARRDAKTSDHYFTGFPSVLEHRGRLPPGDAQPAAAERGALLTLAVLVFVPVRYVYPSRTPTLMVTTVAFCVVWAIQMLAMIWQLPASSPALLVSAFAFPVYYVVLSLLLTARRLDAS